MQLSKNLFKKIGLLVSVAAITVLTACDSVDTGYDTSPERAPLSALALTQPQSCDAYKEYVTSSLIKRYTTIPRYSYYGCNRSGGGINNGQPEPVTVGAPESSADANLGARPPGPDDVSQTNNQEAGVNEGDMIKVDSKTGTVFIAHSKYLLIADAYPPQNMSLVKKIDMQAAVIDLLYDEVNTRLTVVTQYQNQILYLNNSDILLPGGQAVAIDGLIAPEPNPMQPETMISFFDVSATLDSTAAATTPPADPVLIKQISIEGYYQTSRRIDTRIHMVTRHKLNPIAITADIEFQQLNQQFYEAISNASCDVSGTTVDVESIENDPKVITARENLSAKITTVVATLDVSTFLPQAKISASTGLTAELTDVANFLQCNDVYHPKVKSQLGMQVVSSMDSNGDNLGSSGIMNNSWLTYISKSSLYIAENSNHWWWNRSDNVDQTAIHKFTISDQRPVYVATGEVAGHANNSFNFSEHKGFLRVATTQNDITPATADSLWSNQFKNHMFVLADDNIGNLNVVGSVRDLAINETIRSVRFMGDRGFMVTFRNIDPLFTFDLSNPLDPILKGELKIPGFSSYMHPYDDNHLLTIGRAGNEAGTGVGNDFQLQLIDVTDMSNPSVVARFEISRNLSSGYSWSAASYDHHAFTFYKPANLLIIPMQIYASDPTLSFSGMAAFKITLDDGVNSASITEIGRVDHSDLAKKYYCDPNILAPEYDWACLDSSYIYWAAPRRSIVMTESEKIYMYTISDMGMKAGQLTSTYTPVNGGGLLFPPQIYPWLTVGAVDSNTGSGDIAIR